MFSPSRDQARELFFRSWEKYRSGQSLEGLESTALEVIVLHPEYQELLSHRERNIDRDYLPDSGELNPFLHLSLHLSIAEQLSIDQPPDIRKIFQQLQKRIGDRHGALHVVLECLGETLWQASRAGTPPDQTHYLDGLREQLNRLN